MTMNNIVEHWIKMVTGNGESLSMVVKQLSEQTGTHITVSRLGEWRRGKRSMPRNVQRVMLAEALPGILFEYGIKNLPDLANDDVWLKLADAIMPPKINSPAK